MRYILFLITIFIALSCQKQQEKKETKVPLLKLPPRKVINQKTLIGFACYYAGSESNSVKNVSEILKNRGYKNLKVKLYDVNPAEKFLATVACEKLQDRNLIKLTEKEFDQIKINKVSKEKVTICAGCTNEEELTLEEMFSSENNFLADSIEEWINELIK